MNLDPSRFVTHDHIQPIKQTLKEHQEFFVNMNGWKGDVDRRFIDFHNSNKKICETLKETEAEVTTKQNELFAQQRQLTEKFDREAEDRAGLKAQLTIMSGTLNQMAMDAATERGRKEEREKIDAESKASFTRKVVLISATLAILQILVIASNWLSSNYRVQQPTQQTSLNVPSK